MILNIPAGLVLALNVQHVMFINKPVLFLKLINATSEKLLFS